MRHWQQTDPARYQQIPNPETFFTQLALVSCMFTDPPPRVRPHEQTR
jgi:hypothetical protein